MISNSIYSLGSSRRNQVVLPGRLLHTLLTPRTLVRSVPVPYKIILDKLTVDICIHTHVEDPYPEDTIVVTQAPNLIFGRFSITHKSIIEVIYDQGLFIREIYDNLSDNEKRRIICSMGNIILFLIKDILAIQAE